MKGFEESHHNATGSEGVAGAREGDPTARWPAPPVVSFVAKSGSGKTTFLELLISELVARGLEVGVVKHHSHPTPFDVPGKDTYRMSEAGAKVVVGVGSVQVATFRKADGEPDLAEVIARDMLDVDLVITEGFKREDYPKIEVHRSEHARDLLCSEDELMALVTDERMDVNVPQFALDDVAGVAAFLVAWAVI